MTESKSVENKAANSSKVTQVTPFQRFVSQINSEAELTKQLDNGSAIAAQVATRMVEADTLDDAFDAQDSGIANGKDLVDVELNVTDFDTLPSDQQYKEHSPLGVYVKVYATRLDTGEEIQFATGASNVVTLLHKARQLDALPLECMIKSKQTANGNLLLLKRLPKRVIKN